MPDTLTKAQRRYCMSRVRNKDTDIETFVRSALHRRGYRFRKHRKDLPGRPDIAFIGPKVAVFINGDFWHGRQFQRLRPKISPFWVEKIGKNRARDLANYSSLRRMGWMVIRVWQHDIKRHPDLVITRIEHVLARRRPIPSREGLAIGDLSDTG